MTTALSVIQIVKDIASTANSMLGMYRDTNTVDIRKRTYLRERINELVARTHARALGDLTRINIEELVKTQRLIDSYGTGGRLYEMQMVHLRELSNALVENLCNFSG